MFDCAALWSPTMLQLPCLFKHDFGIPLICFFSVPLVPGRDCFGFIERGDCVAFFAQCCCVRLYPGVHSSGWSDD